jgi:sugar lactone lactonase YvrE
MVHAFQYSIVEAKLVHRIQFPAKNITNCAFGGKNNQELYVSTATKGMNKADLRKFRYSGFFFGVKTNSKGVLQKKFILSNEAKRSLL